MPAMCLSSVGSVSTWYANSGGAGAVARVIFMPLGDASGTEIDPRILNILL